MTDEERQLLSTVATLNRRMGSIVVAVLSTTAGPGALSITRIEALADIVSDMSTLLDNHIERVRQREGIAVIDGSVESPRSTAAECPCPHESPQVVPACSGQGVASESPGVRAALASNLPTTEPTADIAVHGPEPASATQRDPDSRLLD